MKYHLKRNSAKCLKCGDEIESKHRHDYVSCKCGAIAVDGGLTYSRRVGNLTDCLDTSEFREYSLQEYRDELVKIKNSEKFYGDNLPSYHLQEEKEVLDRISELTQN